MSEAPTLVAIAALGLLAGCGEPAVPNSPLPAMPAFAPEELEAIRALWIGTLPSLPADASNRVADDADAAALGEAIFFDARFSANGEVSCASCHDPDRAFTDGRARGEGIGEVPRNTMTVLGTAHSSWLFWDGRKDSQWAQALGPLENAAEHGGNRGMYAHVIEDHHREPYEAVFGALPDLDDLARFPETAGPVPDGEARANWTAMSPFDRDAVTAIYANIGKAIAAYERTLVPGASRFDGFAEAVINGDDAGSEALTDAEVAGLRLFIGPAGCTNCHNGPLLSNQGFHNTGIPPVPGAEPDPGRSAGIGLVQADEFNCLSRWSDAAPDDCVTLRFLRTDAEAFIGAFKPPSLRNIARTAPYMHAGQIASLREVLRHYRGAPAAAVGRSELEPLDLTDAQLDQLEAFLRALDDLPADR